MQSIGIYVPGWLTSIDRGEQHFADELLDTIRVSGRYQARIVNLRSLRLGTREDARRYIEARQLRLILQHDSKFYSAQARYAKNVDLLEPQVTITNSTAAQAVGHNKQHTKEVLRAAGIPVLPDSVTTSVTSLMEALADGKWHVVKPLDEGGGTGVRLVRSEHGHLQHFRNGHWQPVVAFERTTKEGGTSLTLRRGLGILPAATYTYQPMLVEPYFNDDARGFSSLRCTVIGNTVVESVRRTNERNITSNVSGGGTATATTLTDEQRDMAIAAKQAVGAEYAGVDLLVCGGKSVVGEVNIGPFTVFSAYTGVPVGKLLAEHLMDMCDRQDAGRAAQ